MATAWPAWPIAFGCALGPAAHADVANAPVSGIMFDCIPAELPPEVRQSFADEVRKSRIAQLPDPMARVPRVATAEPSRTDIDLHRVFAYSHAQFNALRISVAPIAALTVSSADSPLAGAVSKRLFSVVTADSALTLNHHVGSLSGSSVRVVPLNLVGAAMLDDVHGAAAVTATQRAIDVVMDAITSAHNATTATVFYLGDWIEALLYDAQPHGICSASAFISWIVRIVATAAVRGSSAFRVVFGGVATTILHDELFSNLLQVAPMGTTAFVELTADVDFNPTMVPIAPSENATLFDSIADCVVDVHTDLVLQAESDSDDDNSAAVVRPKSCIVVLVPSPTFAELLTSTLSSRYVAEPLRLVDLSVPADVTVRPATASEHVPLTALMTVDSLAEAPRGALLRRLKEHHGVDKISVVVHSGITSGVPGDRNASEATIRRHCALLRTEAGTPPVVDCHVSPPVNLPHTSGESIALQSGAVAPRYVSDPRRRRALDGDDVPLIGFGTALMHVPQLDHRHIIAMAETLVALAQSGEALVNFWSARDGEAQPRAVPVALDVLCCDVATPLPALLGASDRSGGATVGTCVASYTALAELFTSQEIDGGRLVACLTPCGRVTAKALAKGLGIVALRFFVASTASAAVISDPTSIFVATERLARDRAWFLLPHGNVIASSSDTATMTWMQRVLCLIVDVARLRGSTAAPSAADAAPPVSGVEGWESTAALYASYPVVFCTGDGATALTVTSLAHDVLELSAVAATRFHLAMAAPRSLRTTDVGGSLRGRAAAPVCRGWAPLAPCTSVHSSGAETIQRVDAAEAPAVPLRIDDDDDDGDVNKTAAAAGGNRRGRGRGAEIDVSGSSSVATVPTRAFVASCQGLAFVFPDASLGSAMEGFVPPILAPSDATAALVAVKYVLRTYISNVFVLSWGEQRAATATLSMPSLPRSITSHAVWLSLVTTRVDSKASKSCCADWIDGVAIKQPVSVAAMFDTITDGVGHDTAEAIAKLSLRQQPSDRDGFAMKSNRTETADTAASNTTTNDPLKGFVGTLPPPAERAFIDDVVKKLCAKGRAAAEAKVRDKPAFAFVLPNHAFHAYYLHAARRFEATMLAQAAGAV